MPLTVGWAIFSAHHIAALMVGKKTAHPTYFGIFHIRPEVVYIFPFHACTKFIVPHAPASRNAGAFWAEFPRWSMGTINQHSCETKILRQTSGTY